MINYCDRCHTIKERDAFEDYYEYEENVCIQCAENVPTEEELDEGDEFIHRLDEMMFGEDEEDCLPEEDEDFVYDGEIDEEEDDE